MPVVGANFDGLTSDSRSWYYPSQPANGKSGVASLANLNPVLQTGATVIFWKGSGNVQYGSKEDFIYLKN